MGCAYSLRIIDQQLAKLMDAYGSWDRAVTEARWILVGDHAQSPIGGFSGYAVDVFKAFSSFRVAPPAGPGLLRGGYDLAIAPNDRSALLYLADSRQVEAVVAELRTWPSVEQIAWRAPPVGAEPDLPEAGWITCMHAETGRRLSWRPGGASRDAFGRTWSLRGDASVLDLREEGARLHDGDFPDPLGRLEGSLNGGCDVVITAKLGYEFTTGFTMGKGNHGSLHREDSCVPLLTVGLAPPPRPVRTQDLVPMILEALALPPLLADWSPSWSSSSG
jgi:hypothetical protein